MIGIKVSTIDRREINGKEVFLYSLASLKLFADLFFLVDQILSKVKSFRKSAKLDQATKSKL